jgi:hypothetical protein
MFVYGISGVPGLLFAMDRSGRAILSWYESDDKYGYYSYIRYAPDVGWSRVAVLVDSEGFYPLPRGCTQWQITSAAWPQQARLAFPMGRSTSALLGPTRR